MRSVARDPHNWFSYTVIGIGLAGVSLLLGCSGTPLNWKTPSKPSRLTLRDFWSTFSTVALMVTACDYRRHAGKLATVRVAADQLDQLLAPIFDLADVKKAKDLLAAAQTGVESFHARRAAVVGEEDNDGVVA